MGDIGDIFNAQRADTKKHRALMLEQANTEGWTAHTEHHFSRVFNGTRMHWWPSGGKAMFGDKMIYGHNRVNAKIARLIAAETAERRAT